MHPPAGTHAPFEGAYPSRQLQPPLPSGVEWSERSHAQVTLPDCCVQSWSAVQPPWLLEHCAQTALSWLPLICGRLEPACAASAAAAQVGSCGLRLDDEIVRRVRCPAGRADRAQDGVSLDVQGERQTDQHRQVDRGRGAVVGKRALPPGSVSAG